MGNSVGIYILLDANVQAGEVCNGKVVLESKKKNLRGLSSVSLTICGKEKVRIRSNPTLPSSSDLSEHCFYNEVLELKTFKPDHKLKKGTHIFPFSIMIPETLPASTKYPNNGNSHSEGYRIQYKMVAQVIGNCNSMNSSSCSASTSYTASTSNSTNSRSTTSSLTSRHYLQQCHKRENLFCCCEREITVLSQPLPPEKAVYMLPPTTHKVLGVCSKPAGVMTMGAKLIETHVGRGETLQLHLACRNYSTVDIKRVQVRVIERVELQSMNKRHGKPIKPLIKEEVLCELKNVISPGLERTKKSRTSMKMTKSIALQELHESIYEDLNSGNNEFQLPVPVFARETYAGNLIKVSHCVHIAVQMSTLTSSSSHLNTIEKMIPVEIGQPSLSCTIFVEEMASMSSLSFYPERDYHEDSIRMTALNCGNSVANLMGDFDHSVGDDINGFEREAVVVDGDKGTQVIVTPVVNESTEDGSPLVSDDSQDDASLWMDEMDRDITHGSSTPGMCSSTTDDSASTSDHHSDHEYDIEVKAVKPVKPVVKKPTVPNRERSFFGRLRRRSLTAGYKVK